MRPLALGNRFGVDEEDVKKLVSSEEEEKTGKPIYVRRRSFNQILEVEKVASSEKEKKKRKRIDVRTDLFNQMPYDVKYQIFSKLFGPFEILLRAQYVCSSWRNLSKDPRLYRVIKESDLDHFARYFGRYFCKYDCYRCGYVSEDNYCIYCRRWKCKWIGEAVDRSCGQLTELHIAYCLSDDLLHYIFDKSKHLKRFVLERGWDISDDGLVEAFRKVPLLEEFDSSCFSDGRLSKDLIAEIGRSCMNLKHFSLFGTNDKRAFAIAENMPKLHCLGLLGKLSNKGLKTILDGCPCLEYLDISGCFGIKIDEKLREQCEKKVKHVEWNQKELLLDRGGHGFGLPLMPEDDYHSDSDSSF